MPLPNRIALDFLPYHRAQSVSLRISSWSSWITFLWIAGTWRFV